MFSQSGPPGVLGIWGEWLFIFREFKYVIIFLPKDKYILGRIGLYFWGIWGEAELILGISPQESKYF